MKRARWRILLTSTIVPFFLTLTMESQNTSTQNMSQSAFFYYNPESAADHRQHGHFSPHPKTIQDGAHTQQYQQQWMHHQAMLYGQPPMMYPQVPAAVAPKGVVVAPRPALQRPAFLYQQDGQPLAVDTDCSTPDVQVYPSTPALSVSGSTASSPPSTCGILPTPVTGSYMNIESLEGVKEGCQGEVKSEILAGGDFTRCDTPPLTPGMHDCSNLFRTFDRCAMFDSNPSQQFFWWCQFLERCFLFPCHRTNDCSTRSIHSPAFGYGKPSLRPPIHQLLSISFTIAITSVPNNRH